MKLSTWTIFVIAAAADTASALSCKPTQAVLESATVIVSMIPISGVALKDRRVFKVAITEVWKGPVSEKTVVVVYGVRNLLLGEKVLVAAELDDQGRIVIADCTFLREDGRVEATVIDRLGPPLVSYGHTLPDEMPETMAPNGN